MSVLAVIGWAVLKFVVIAFGWVLLLSAILSLVERKQSAYVQDRLGPNRAYIPALRWLPMNNMLGQIIADALKLFVKEDFEPTGANKWLFRIAPGLALIPVMIAWAVIPFGPGPLPGAEGSNYFLVADLNGGVLFILAIGGIGIYAGTLGAWAANNSFTLLGGLRTAAQMVSYEVTLGLSLVGIFMVFGSFKISDIIWGQGVAVADVGGQMVQHGELLWGFLPKWGIVVQPVAFILFLIAAIAETKRAPFDLPEGESEIAGGYFLEYSGMRFALYFLGEFAAVILNAGIMTTLFLGGWQIPWVDTPVDASGAPIYGWLTVAQVLVFIVKMLFVVWLQMQIRWTLPRVRYDQLMKLGWLYLLPLSLLNLAVTAVVMYLIR